MQQHCCLNIADIPRPATEGTSASLICVWLGNLHARARKCVRARAPKLQLAHAQAELQCLARLQARAAATPDYADACVTATVFLLEVRKVHSTQH